MAAGAGRFQIHWMFNNKMIAKGGLRDLPRIGDTIKFMDDPRIMIDMSAVGIEYTVSKVLWNVKDPVNLVVIYLQSA